MSSQGKPFLTARWENLLMLNYPCPPELLTPHLPHGVELDTWQGQTLVSVVGFMFLDTKVMGVRIPGHVNFEEVNLRFYVKRLTPQGEVRRGVVFIRELVPKPMIAFTARKIYEEPYLAAPMGHKISIDPDQGGNLEYTWTLRDADYRLAAEVKGPAKDLQADSEEEFITEHYWGYTKRSRGFTSEYQVAHPSWRVWRCSTSAFEGEIPILYGRQFVEVLSGRPQSALLALGSEVAVYPGKRL